MPKEVLPVGHDLLQLLQLAVNSSCSRAAGDVAVAAAFELPDAIIEPDVARKLLVTAAARQHDCVVLQLLADPAIQQHADGDTYEVVISQLIIAEAKDGWHPRRVRYCEQTSAAVQLSAAELLNSEAAARLLHTAVLHGRLGYAEYLCQLPAAQLLGNDAVLPLLSEAVEQEEFCNCTATLCSLPGAVQLQLSSGDALHLLQAAVQRDDAISTAALCSLPAAADISSTEALQLLKTALQHYSQECLEPLVCLEGAHQLSCDAVAQLLHTAVQQRSRAYAAALQGLPGAQQLSSEAVLDLLVAAVGPLLAEQDAALEQLSSAGSSMGQTDVSSSGNNSSSSGSSSYGSRISRARCAEVLCMLPGAQQLPSAVLVQLLQAAVKHGTACVCIGPLLGLPAAQYIASSVMVQLLVVRGFADTQDIDDIVWMVCMAEAAQSGADVVAALLSAAIRLGSSWCVARLSQLPAAQQLGSDTLAGLLQAALLGLHTSKKSRHVFVQSLCGLAAAKTLGSSIVADLLLTVVQQHNPASVLRSLCKLQAAQQLGTAVVFNLLQAVVMCSSADSITALSQLPGAQQLSGEAVGQLLLAAEQQGCTGCAEQLHRLPAAASIVAGVAVDN